MQLTFNDSKETSHQTHFNSIILYVPKVGKWHKYEARTARRYIMPHLKSQSTQTWVFLAGSQED
jgi:hypothetical protein